MDKKRRNQLLAVGGIAIVVIIIIIGATLLFQAPVPLEEEAQEESTFELISYTDGEDVSNFVEISIWTPDPDKKFNDDEDWQKIANFEEDVSSKDADDVKIDLTDYKYVWVEIDPDAESVFENHFYRISGGENFNYSLFVYHHSSDVHLSTSNRGASEGWDLITDANATLVMDFPERTTTDIHANSDDWECDDTCWDDLSSDEKDDYYDERNYRAQAPIYVLNDDTDKDFDDNIERGTNFYAIEFDFNETISSTSGDINNVNFTIDENVSAEVKETGDKIYVIYTSVVTAIETLDFDISLGKANDGAGPVGITCDTIKSGRLDISGDLSSFDASDFTAYSSSITA